MFFGLTNSPATFQALMNSIFADLIVQGKVAVYLDDILIYTKTLEEHEEIVKEAIKMIKVIKDDKIHLPFFYISYHIIYIHTYIHT